MHRRVRSSIALKVNPLRRFRYQTWDELGDKLGLAGARALANHRGPPDKRPAVSAQLQACVDALFEQKFPFPLPHYQQLIRKRIVAAKREPGAKALLEVVEEIEGIVADSAPTNPHHAAGLQYIHFLALHARAVLNDSNGAFGGKAVCRIALVDAIAALEKGREIIAATLRSNRAVPGAATLRELDTWLFLNWVVAIGSYVPGDPEPDAAGYEARLRECRALARFRLALWNLPHEWRVPYNGLDVASRLGAGDMALRRFYRCLCQFDSGFADLRHTPGEVPSIAANPGMEHFRRRCLANPSIIDLQRKDSAL